MLVNPSVPFSFSFSQRRSRTHRLLTRASNLVFKRDLSVNADLGVQCSYLGRLPSHRGSSLESSIVACECSSVYWVNIIRIPTADRTNMTQWTWKSADH